MMLKIEELSLITGIPIQVPNTSVQIHQPTIKEIALLGESKFFQAMNIFFIDKEHLVEFVNEVDTLTEEEKAVFIADISAYETLKFLIKASFVSGEGRDQLNVMHSVNTAFQMLIPGVKVKYMLEQDEMILTFDNGVQPIILDKMLFLLIRDIASQILLLDTFFKNEENEMSEAARKIAQKIAESEQKIRQSNGEDKEESYFSRILSIMGVYKDFDYLSSLTIYQLQDQFERHGLYSSFNQSIDATLAGAREVEIVDWYKKL